MTPADVIWFFLFVGLAIRLWPRPAPPPVRKGSPLYTPPAEVPGGALARAMKRGGQRPEPKRRWLRRLTSVRVEAA